MKWFKVFQSKEEKGNDSSASTDVTHISPGSSSEPKKGLLARMGWRSKRAEQLEALQTGYQQLLGLMESIRNHLEEQSHNQEKLLGQMPDAIEGLKSVGKAAEQHTEVIQLVKQQFESSVEHDRKLVESMDSFNKTLALMDTTSRTSSDMVRRMSVRSQESENMLHAALERSEKRMMGMVVVMIMAFLGLGLALIYVVRPALFGHNLEALADPSFIAEETPAVYPAAPPVATPILDEEPQPTPEEIKRVEEDIPAPPTAEPAPPPKTKNTFYFYKK